MITTQLSKAARIVSSLPKIPGALSLAVRVEARILLHEARSKPGDFWPAVVLQAAAGGSFLLGLWFSLHITKGFLGDRDPGLALALVSMLLASYALLWFCFAVGGAAEIVPGLPPGEARPASLDTRAGLRGGRGDGRLQAPAPCSFP